MMDCRTVIEKLPTYVLGELDRAAEVELSEHLRECTACRTEEAELRSDVGRIACALESDLRAPTALMEQVEAAVLEAEGRKRYVPGRIWISALAACAMALLAFFIWPARPTGLSLDRVVETHSEANGAEGAKPTQQLISRLSDVVGFPIDITPIRNGAVLADCRVVQVDGFLAAAVAFETGGKTVVVYQIPAKEVALLERDRMRRFGKDLYCISRGSISLIAWHCRDCVFIATAAMDLESLARLAEPLIRMA